MLPGWTIIISFVLTMESWECLGNLEPEQVVVLPENQEQQSTTFIALIIFADVACSLADGTPLEELGTPTDNYIQTCLPETNHWRDIPLPEV